MFKLLKRNMKNNGDEIDEIFYIKFFNLWLHWILKKFNAALIINNFLTLLRKQQIELIDIFQIPTKAVHNL